MSDKARMKRLERAQMRVLFSVPFFAPGVARLPITLDDETETACTNGERIKFGRAFLDKLTDHQVATVLCHEVCHCMLGHLWRAPGACDWDVWNQATDHAVNLMLKEFSAVVMAKNLADPFPFPEPESDYCMDARFTGLAEEVIYNRLASQKPLGRSGGGKGSGQGGKAPGTPSPGGRPGGKPMFGEMEKPDSGPGQTKSSSKQLQNDWTATLLQSARIAMGQGDCPAGIKRLVNDIVEPKINWVDVLRSWLREQCADDWNFLEPAMEYEGCGFMLPSLKSERMGPVVFATDTSGSINEKLLAEFRAEKQGCLDDMRPSKLVDIYCDAEIQRVDEYTTGDRIGTEAPGGGGTSFVPVWNHIAAMPEKPKCVVYLTDLCGDFGTDPGVPVIWVAYGTTLKAPFGETIYADK